MRFCEKRVLGKSSRVKFSTSIHNSKGTLDYIHVDLWGPAQTISLGGVKYFLSLIHDFSRMVWVYMLKTKDDAFDQFKAWKTLVETQTNREVNRLRTDNGLEFCNKNFDDCCIENGIMRHKTVRHTPQHNGLAEMMNMTLVDKVRCMLIHSKLSKALWAETLSTTCYIVNRSPSSGINFKTPIELWSGKPADYSNLRVFGCPAFAHIKQGKLEPRALNGVFLGYPDEVKGFELWCTDLKPPRAIISRDVVFNEAEMLQNTTQPKTMIIKLGDRNQKFHFEVELSTSNARHEPRVEPESESDMQIPESIPNLVGDKEVRDYQFVRDREKRVIKPPKRYAYADPIAFALTVAHEVEPDEPRTYSEAVKSNKSKGVETSYG